MASNSSSQKRKGKKVRRIRVESNKQILIILIPGIYIKLWPGLIHRIKVLFIQFNSEFSIFYFFLFYGESFDVFIVDCSRVTNMKDRFKYLLT